MNNTSCGCTLKCFDKLDESQRKKIFAGFWSLGNFDVRNAYLNGCVKVLPVQRRYKKGESRRGNTQIYYVTQGSTSI